MVPLAFAFMVTRDQASIKPGTEKSSAQEIPERMIPPEKNEKMKTIITVITNRLLFIKTFPIWGQGLTLDIFIILFRIYLSKVKP
jgi:hypothetical protein